MKELSIVTSCHGYGQYLKDWAESILAQTELPGFVGILTHGIDRQYGEQAAKILSNAMFHVEHVHVPDRLDFGEARNRAVALSHTEWVMHFDCDDMLMPHAVAEIARLAPKADVVSLGYERCGDLAAGPKQLVKTYRTHRGQGTLDDPTPCSGVSPFRRSFWEQSPYRTDMIGGWDTALWLGFAHLNARFVPTPKPCFWYRQHADSTFNVRRKSGWPAEWTGKKLQGLRRGDKGVAVIVPRQADGDHRDRSWRWLKARFQALYPEWEIIEGVCGGEWSKGQTIANALEKCTADTLIIADSDCVHDAMALRHAVELVQTGTPWVVPHRMVYRLGELETELWLTTDPERSVETPSRKGLARGPYEGFAGGGSVVVPRATYEAVGGIPKNFTGWGAEDETLALLLDTLAGPHVRLPYDCIHLWHPAQPDRKGPLYLRNRRLHNRYRLVAGLPEQMFALVKSGVHSGEMPYYTAEWRYRTHAARGAAMREEITGGKSGVNFTMRKMAQQHETNRERKAARDALAAQRKVNAAAYQAGLAARRLKAAAQHPNKMRTEFVNKSTTETVVEPDKGLTVTFASEQAEALAKEYGLTDADFEGVEPGPRGFSAPQVRNLR